MALLHSGGVRCESQSSVEESASTATLCAAASRPSV